MNEFKEEWSDMTKKERRAKVASVISIVIALALLGYSETLWMQKKDFGWMYILSCIVLGIHIFIDAMLNNKNKKKWDAIFCLGWIGLAYFFL